MEEEKVEIYSTPLGKSQLKSKVKFKLTNHQINELTLLPNSLF
jgi:hypothetical protein